MTKIHQSVPDTLHRAEQALIAVLPHSVKVCTAKRDTKTDLIVNGQRLRIKWIGEGTLAEAKNVLAE